MKPVHCQDGRYVRWEDFAGLYSIRAEFPAHLVYDLAHIYDFFFGEYRVSGAHNG
jgi:glycine/serine hydroxymethyltransferase